VNNMNPLSRVAMQNIIRNKNPRIDLSKESKGINLSGNENSLILDIIKGEKEVIENKEKNTMISLDEAVNRIKNNR